MKDIWVVLQHMGDWAIINCVLKTCEYNVRCENKFSILLGEHAGEGDSALKSVLILCYFIEIY